MTMSRQIVMETDTVTLGTVSKGVRITPPAATESTGVPYVAPHHTPPSDALPYDFLPIITPLNADAFEDALRTTAYNDKFAHIPHGLRHGFDMGVHSVIYDTYTPKNHTSALSHPTAVDKYINTELLARRYTGPFSRSRLEHIIGPFRSCPLGVVPKAGSQEEYRLVEDFSFPRNDPQINSINSEIDLEAFACDWGTFSEIVLLVMDAPPGTEAATLDVDAAFRRCPIRPSQQNHFIIGWKDKFYIDHNAPFGASSSGGVWGQLADAMTAILISRNIGPIKKWVDDFLFLRYPNTTLPGRHTFTYDLETIHTTAREFGWPWKPSKTKPFASTFKYLGFRWSLIDKSVEIPEDKKERYLQKLAGWGPKRKVSLKEAESLLGTLAHCTFAVPDGRSHIPALSRFTASFSHTKSNFSRRTPNATVFADITWWSETLSRPFCGSQLVRPPSISEVEIWVDASSSWGVGIVFNGAWDTWKLADGWRSEGRDIGWAEMVAIEIALRFAVELGFSNVHFRFRSDNQGVIQALDAGKSRNSQQNRVLQRIVATMRTNAIWLSTHYVPSAKNLADRPSRGLPLDLPRTNTLTPLPLCLQPLLTRPDPLHV